MERNKEVIDDVVRHLKTNPLCGIGFGKYSFNNPIRLGLIKEGVIRSYPINKTIDWVKHYIGYDEPPLDKLIKTTVDEYNEENVIFVFVIKNNANYGLVVSKLEQAMELCGWHLSRQDEMETNEAYPYVVFQYLPKFKETEVNVLKYPLLYHLSPSKHKNKIMKQGLCPRSSNDYFSYPSRVYCMFGNLSAREIITTMLGLEKANNGIFNKSYILYGIDTSLLPNNIRFFKDSTFDKGVYTTDNIPPNCLRIIQEINADIYKKLL